MFLFYISDWKLATKMVLGMSFVPLIVDWLSGGLPRLKSKGKWLLSFLQELKRKQTALYTNHFFINRQFVFFFLRNIYPNQILKTFMLDLADMGRAGAAPFWSKICLGKIGQKICSQALSS